MEQEPKKKKKKNKTEAMLSAKNQIMSIVIVAVILVLTFVFLINGIFDTEHPVDLSEVDFWSMNWLWFLPAVACLVLSVGFEAINLKILSHKVGYKRSLRQSMIYASSDIYFSAITPSATGGQPAAAYYMTKSGMPLALSTAVLVLNVTIYTIGLLAISVFALLMDFDTFLNFSTLEQVCVWVGFGFHAILVVICFVCMFSKRVIYFLGDMFFGLLAKLRIVKNKEDRIRAFRASVANYQNALNIVREHRWLIPVLLINGIMQRVVLAPITFFVLRAMMPLGVPSIHFLDVFIMQLYCTVGSSAMPLPGGAGIAETLFISMFEGMPIMENVTHLCFLAMLLSRFFSSYLSIIACGGVTMTHHIRMKRAEFRRRRTEFPFETEDAHHPEAALDGVADADLPPNATPEDRTSAPVGETTPAAEDSPPPTQIST